MNQEFGHHAKQLYGGGEYLALSFSPLSAPLRSRWRNNGVSADFLGDYVTTFLPGDGAMTGSGKSPKEIKYAVTYIANEFLENAMKYHEREVDTPIAIRLDLTSERISISVSNSASHEQAERYRDFVDQIVAGDAGELMLRQLESNASLAGSESCMGLLTIVSDYDARLGWRFESSPADAGPITVTTSAELSIRTVLGVTE
jgi:hypothetical protein